MKLPFQNLSGYPQYSLSSTGDWSEPILGGVGCNFFMGRKGNVPPFTETHLWEQFGDIIRDMQMGMLRVGFLPDRAGDIAASDDLVSPWNETTQRYDFSHDYFHALRFLNALAQEVRFPIMIDPWWIPSSQQVKPTTTLDGWRGAPANHRQYAETFILPLVRHVVDELGCDRVTHIGLLNEPIWHASDREPKNYLVSPGEDQLVVLTEMYKAVRQCLDANGYERIDIVGPSALCAYQFPMADFLASQTDPTPYLGAFDHHYYLYHNDQLKAPNDDFFSTHEMVDGNVRRWCDFSRRQGKPFLVTEMGSFAYGRLFWGERDLQGPASHTCAISDADFIIRSAAYGAQGFLRWCFSVPERYDGRWGLVEWNDTEVWGAPNTYDVYSTLMRSLRPGSRVLPIDVGRAAGLPCHVSAIAVKDDGRLNILIVNSQPGLNHDIVFGDGPWQSKCFDRIVTDEVNKQKTLSPIDFNDTNTFVLTPYSLTWLREQSQ